MKKVRFRVVTYNIHKCRGMDGRTRPDRIAAVLRELDADVIALQEVISVRGGAPEEDQYEYLAHAAGLHHQCFGENRRHRGGAYGNAILSRLPVHRFRNCDLTCTGREPRGVLRADVEVATGNRVYVFNAHLGTSFFERRQQARLIMGETALGARDLHGPRVIVGDFNEWTRGLVTRTLEKHFQSVDIRQHQPRARTYPGFMPVLHLDHVYYDQELQLASFKLHRSRTSLIASDHLPMVADFEL